MMILLLLPAWGGAGPASGERLGFYVHWLGLPGGVAHMGYEEPYPNRHVFTASLRSVGVVWFFHPVNDVLSARASFTPQGLLAESYSKQQLEGKTNRQTEFHFQRDLRRVQWKREEGGETKVKEFTDVAQVINDPLSAFYAIRFLPELKSGATIPVPLIDGEKLYDAKIQVGEPETVETPLGRFQAMAVRPVVQQSEFFRHEGALTIWLTTDSRRLPVLVESQVRLSSVRAELTSFDDGRGGRATVRDERFEGEGKQP